MTANRYEILVRAILDRPNLKKDLETFSATVNKKFAGTKEGIKLNLDTEHINQQVTRWRNRLKNLEILRPAAFKSDEVQNVIKNDLDPLIATYEKTGKGAYAVGTALTSVDTAMKKSSAATRVLNQDGLGLGKTIAMNAKKVAMWAVATGAFYGTLAQIKKGIQYLKDLDVEMTNIAVVTGMTNAEVGQLAIQYNELATALGSTTIEIAKGSLEWFRQGKTVQETAKLMEQTMMLAKLGNMESAQSTEYLTSIINGFKLEAEETALVVDKLIALDNEYATSVAEISAALQKSSNSAQQAGVDFDALASYITVISSVTRQSGESIGTSLRTMFARMQNIKLGKLFEDDATNISDVEKALSLVDIELRDSETSFKDMDAILDEIASKWNALNEVEQSALATTIAGIRQRENFLVLMNNYDEVLKAQTISAESAGLAQQRYSIYLDSVEASVNKLTAAWEKMVASTGSSKTTKSFIDFGTMLIKIVDEIGILNIAIVVLATYLGVKFVSVVALASKAIEGLIALFGILTGTIAITSTALAGFGIGLIVVGLIQLFENLNKNIIDTYNNFEKLKAQSDSNRQELKSLADEYEELANKTEKTSEEQLRLLDIQTILNTKYSNLLPSIMAYSDAMDGNTDAIKANAQAIRDAAVAEAELFMERNKYDYDEAVAVVEDPGVTGIRGYGPGGSGFIEGTIDERISQIDKLIESSGESASKFLRKVRDDLYEQKNAAESLIIEWKNYDNIVKIFSKETNLEPAKQSLEDLVSVTSKVNKSLNEGIKLSLGLINSYEEYGQLSLDQVAQLQEAFPDDYLDLMYTEGEYVKLNTDNLRSLVAVRAENALEAAKQALSTANSTNSMKESSIVALEAALNISEATNAMTVARLTSQLALQRASLVDTRALRAEVEMAQARANSFRDGTFWTNEATQALYGHTSAINAAREAQDRHTESLRETLKVIQRKKKAEKDALQEQLDGYKKIIDAKKRIIDQEREEDRYQDELANKNRELSDIENELLQIQFDNSDEAKKRRLELEDEKAKKIIEIDEFQTDRSVELQKDALDQEYEDYKENIEKKIKAIDDYLETVTIHYNNLIAESQRAASAIGNSISNGYNMATNAVNNFTAATARAIEAQRQFLLEQEGHFAAEEDHRSNYEAFYDGSTLRYRHKESGRYVSETYYKMLPNYHLGGIVGSSSVKENEILATLLKGEVVATEDQAYNFIRNVLPTLLNAGGAGDTVVPVNVTIEGNVDKDVMVDLKTDITKAVYDAMTKRGTVRGVNSFSI